MSLWSDDDSQANKTGQLTSCVSRVLLNNYLQFMRMVRFLAWVMSYWTGKKQRGRERCVQFFIRKFHNVDGGLVELSCLAFLQSHSASHQRKQMNPVLRKDNINPHQGGVFSKCNTNCWQRTLIRNEPLLLNLLHCFSCYSKAMISKPSPLMSMSKAKDKDSKKKEKET